MTSECHWASHRCNIVPPTQILTVLCNLHFILLLIVPKVERAQRQIFWQHQGMNTSVCRAQRSSVLFNSSSPACHTAARHRGATHPHTVSLLAVCLSFYTSTGHIYSRVCVCVAASTSEQEAQQQQQQRGCPSKSPAWVDRKNSRDDSETTANSPTENSKRRHMRYLETDKYCYKVNIDWTRD